MVDAWKETANRTLVETRVYTLEERKAVNPRTDVEVPIWVLESSDWVNVIPVDDEGRIVVVRQYRHGTRSVTVEIPGGVIEPGEAPEAGARRELREETGYEAGELELIGVVEPNPAILTNATYTFLAKGVQKVAGLDLDQAEDIDVGLLELTEIQAMIDRGEITHSLVVAAFYWLERRQGLGRELERVLGELSRSQTDKVAALAKRVNAGLTAEDLRNPQDFPELVSDPDWCYQDGMLAGIESVRMALRALSKGVC